MLPRNKWISRLAAMRLGYYIKLILLIALNGCDEPQYNYGCTDPEACNFDLDANIYDNTCIYQTESCACDGVPIDGYCDCLGSIED